MAHFVRTARDILLDLRLSDEQKRDEILKLGKYDISEEFIVDTWILGDTDFKRDIINHFFARFPSISLDKVIESYYYEDYFQREPERAKELLALNEMLVAMFAHREGISDSIKALLKVIRDKQLAKLYDLVKTMTTLENMKINETDVNEAGSERTKFIGIAKFIQQNKDIGSVILSHLDPHRKNAILPEEKLITTSKNMLNIASKYQK